MRQLRAYVTGIVVFAVVLVAALGIMWAVGAEYDRAPEQAETVNDEPIVVDKGNWTATDHPDYALSFYDNETVRNSSGSQLSEGTDYEWNTTNGSVYWYESSTDVTDGEEASITYSYAAKRPGTRRVMSVVSIPVRYVLPFSLLVLLAMTMAGLGIGLYRFTDRSFSGRGSNFRRR